MLGRGREQALGGCLRARTWTSGEDPVEGEGRGGRRRSQM